jgi:hypothetical protein
MNHQSPVPTILQRQALAAYNAAHRDAIYQAERSAGMHRAVNLGAFPSMQPVPQRTTVWQQITAELIAAPLGQKIAVAFLFGFGAGVAVALLCGWLA